MKTWSFPLATLATLAGSSVAFAQPAEALKMEPALIRDSMAVNQKAVALLKPHGWTLRGGVKWYPDMAHLACLEFTVSDPHSRAQIEFLPWHLGVWLTQSVIPMPEGTNYLGSIVARPRANPKDVVEQITIPSLRQGARIVKHDELPRVAKALSDMVGVGVRSGRTRIEYVHNGVAMEEDIYLSVFVQKHEAGGGAIYVWGPAWAPFSLRAEKGKLDQKSPLMLASANSIKLNEDWYAEYKYVCQLFVDRGYKAIQGAGELSRRIAQNCEEIRRMNSEAYRKYNQSMDRVSANFSDYIRGVERYKNPAETYPVQLPSGYQHVWYGSNGTYVLSNQESFDPNVGSTVNWQKLERVK